MPTDGTSEQITIFAAKHYVQHGFFENKLLPTYPPFSVDLEGNPRTKPFVYNHYLAGQDLVLGLWIKAFGFQNLGWARLVPHFLTTLGLALFSLAFGILAASPLAALLMLPALLCSRAISVWSTCLWGHSHGTALAFLGWAFFLVLAGRSKYRRSIFFAGFLGSLSVCFFAIDQLSLYCFVVLGLSLVFSSKIGFKKGVLSCLGSVLGFLTAMSYQLTLSTLYYGSFSRTIAEMKAWMSVRTQILTNTNSKFSADFVDHPLHRVIAEMNRQAYGATGFTLYNLVAIGTVFIAMAYASKILSRKQALEKVAALVMGYFAAISWSVVMKHHAMSNIHFIVRHGFSMYVLFLATSIVLIFEVVRKARNHAYVSKI